VELTQIKGIYSEEYQGIRVTWPHTLHTVVSASKTCTSGYLLGDISIFNWSNLPFTNCNHIWIAIIIHICGFG